MASTAVASVPDNRPARTTANWNLPVPAGSAPQDYISDWGTAADAVDGALTAAVAQARTAANSVRARARRTALLFGGN